MQLRGITLPKPLHHQQEDSQPDFFTRLKHRSEKWRDNLPLGRLSRLGRIVGSLKHNIGSLVYQQKQPSMELTLVKEFENGLGICLIWLSHNSTKHLTPTPPTPGPRPTSVTLLCQPQQVAHVVVFSKAKAGLLSFAPRLVEVEVPRDVWGTVTEGFWFYICFNTFLYLFINHDVLPYITSKLFILTQCNFVMFCLSSWAD